MAPSTANQGWKHYWKEDRVASCVPENQTTAEEIRQRWIGLFADLPDGARILDVATGNGVLLAHAASAAERDGKRFSLTGIDLAEIDPNRYVSTLPAALREARFIGGIAAERLPFGDAEFDAVVSQYGLEYANLDKAIGQVERVLAGGGQLIWLAHSEDSLVVAQNRDQAAQVEFLLAAGGPIEAMRRFVAKVAKAKKLDHAAERLGYALRDAEQYCRDHPPANVIREVCTVLAETAQRWQAYRAADLDRMLTDSRRRLIAHRQRINDLSAAVMSPARAEAVRRRLSEGPWEEVSVSDFRVGSTASPIGVMIKARRAAS